MDEREALIAEIRANPEDDAPRLVAADWFEEQGTPADTARADFIRAQVERARLAPNDPAQSELQATELRLLKQYQREWCGSHHLFKKCVFRRGFIEYVHLHLQKFQHHRRELMRLEPVRDVRFTGWWRCQEQLVRQVAECEELRHLQTLRIHHQGPHKDPDGRVLPLLESPHLMGLRKLVCPPMEFSPEEGKRFEMLPIIRKVEELSLPMLDYKAGEWFSERPQLLHELEDLKAVTVGPYSTRLLATLQKENAWQNLRKLDVAFTGWDHDEILPLANWLPSTLESLKLTLGDVYDIDEDDDTGNSSQVAEVCSRIEDLSLTELQLSAASMSPQVLKRVLDASPTLANLNLWSTPLSPAHAEVLAGSSNLKELHTVDISACSRSDEDTLLDSILASPNLKGVSTLMADGCLIADSTLRQMEMSSARFRSLNITGSVRDAQVVERLVRTPPMQSVVWLWISTRYELNRGGWRALDASLFDSLPHLATLYIQGLGDESSKVPWVFGSKENDWSPIHSTSWPPVDESLNTEFSFDRY